MPSPFDAFDKGRSTGGDTATVTHPLNTATLVSTSSATESLNPTPQEAVVKFQLTAEELRKKEPVVFFDKRFLGKLPQVELEKIDAILAADPYFNNGKGQSGKTVLTISNSETLTILKQYSSGKLYDGSEIDALSRDGKKALQALVSWYVEYRKSFPDPTETASLQSNWSYLRETRRENMQWGICVWPHAETGRAAAAFSGQVLEIPREGNAEKIKFTWGEHLYLIPELRGGRMGLRLIKGLENKMRENFGETAFTLIEIDNPFCILDAKDPKNKDYYDHKDPKKREKLWTDPEGPNMAMDPFRRLRFWHGLGFSLLVVNRKDLPRDNNSVALPYNQVALSADGEPCETIVLAVRITDKQIREDLESGKLNVKDFKAMIDAMQASATPDYKMHSTYRACAEELIKGVGLDAKVRLINFCQAEGKELNPEALDILERTAKQKFTAAEYRKEYPLGSINLFDTTTHINMNEAVKADKFRSSDPFKPSFKWSQK